GRVRRDRAHLGDVRHLPPGQDRRLNVMMERSRQSDAGFTLVEVLMAMIVLGIGVSALLTAFATEAKTSLSNRNQSAAESLLTAAAEYVKALPYSSCSAISGTITTAQVPYDNTEFTVTYGPGTALPGAPS